MINYIELISYNHPTVGVSSSNEYDYNSIDWGNETVIPVETLDAEYLALYKDRHLAAMSLAAGNDIINGFQSAALGTAKWYDSAQEDQLNLIGSVTAGDDMYYSCRDTQDGTKTYVLHTHAQLLQVVQDGRTVKLAILQTFNTKKEAILAAVDTAAVDAITW